MFFLSRLRKLFFGKHNPLIFHYRDGFRRRSADPVAVERTLIGALGEDWRTRVESLRLPFPEGLVGEEALKVREDRLKAEGEILAAIDAAFDVLPFADGGGLTVVERFALLEGFNRYCVLLIELGRPFARRQSRASPGPVNSPPPSGPVSSSPATSSPAPAPTPLPTPS